MATLSFHRLAHRAWRALRPGLGGRRPARTAGGRARARPAVEPLEGRTLPSTLVPVATFNPALSPSASAGGVSQALASADGRFTAFTSTAPNLVSGQVHTAVVQNVFLYDHQTGAVTLVSHTPGSPLAEADGNSQDPRVSSDGRYVVYDSTASDLVTGQTGARGLDNVFLYDRTTGNNILISHRAGSPTTAGSGSSTTAFATGFGFDPNATEFFLFTSDAPDLVSGQNGPEHLNLFRYDTALGTTTLVSHSASSALTGADGDTTYGDITPDGAAVVFQSSAADVVPGQTTEDRDNIFLYSAATGSTRLVSGVFNGTSTSPTDAAGLSFRPAVSADGSVVSYISGAGDLVAGQSPSPGANGSTNNVFLFDAVHGTTTLVSGANGSPSQTGNDNSTEAVLSSDGSKVAFISGATNLIAGEGAAQGNVFVYHTATGTLSIASHVQGQPGIAAGFINTRDTGTFGDLSVSADGSLVCYQSSGTDLTAQADNFGSENVFLYDAGSGNNTLVSHVAGSPATGGDRDSLQSHLSADGSTVAFLSFATNLLPGTAIADGGQNLFEYAVAAGTDPQLASRSASLATASSGVYGTSGDGRFVVFTSNAPNLVPGQVDTNFDQDVFLLDRNTGAVTLVSHVPSSATTTGNAGSPGTLAGVGSGRGPVISADGNWVAFVSQATNLVPGEESEGSAGLNQVYLYNRLTGAITLVSHQASSATRVGEDDSDSPTISDDGRFVAYRSRAPDLIVGGDTGSFDTPNIYLYDRATGTNTLVSHNSGSPTLGGDQASSGPTISDDLGGSCVIAYQSLANDLVQGEAALPSENVYLFSSARDANVLLSAKAGTNTMLPVDHNSMAPVVSHDGSTVAFVSFATDLVTGQQPGTASNVFLYTVATGAVRLVSGAGGSSTVPAGGYSDSPALNDSGSRVAFRSDAPDLVAGEVLPAGSTSNVFLYDPNQPANPLTLVSHAAGLPATGAAGDSAGPALDGAGDLVAYLSTATNLVPGQQGGGVNNVFVYSVALQANALVSGQGGSTVVAGSVPSYLALVSRDPVVTLNVLAGAGRTSIAFLNRLTDLVLSPNTVAAGSPPGTAVGAVSVDSVFAGQFLPPVFSLPPGEANNAAFALGATAGGRVPLLLATPAGGPGYLVSVHVNIGLGDEAGLLNVVLGPAAPLPPPPVAVAHPVIAELIAVRVGKKKTTRLMVEVFDVVTGALTESFLSPFQKGTYTNILVTALNSTSAGIPNMVIVTARKGKRRVMAVFLG